MSFQTRPKHRPINPTGTAVRTHGDANRLEHIHWGENDLAIKRSTGDRALSLVDGCASHLSCYDERSQRGPSSEDSIVIAFAATLTSPCRLSNSSRRFLEIICVGDHKTAS